MKKIDFSMKNIKHIWLTMLAVAALSPVAVNAQETYTVGDTIYNPKVVFTA